MIDHSSPLSFFSTTDTGITINRFSQDLQLIDMDLPIAALNTFASTVFLSVSIRLPIYAVLMHSVNVC